MEGFAKRKVGFMEFKDLTPEQQEKLKACKTPEELAALAEETGFELTGEQLEALAGGTPNPTTLQPCPAKILDAPGKKFRKSTYLKNEQAQPGPTGQ